MKILVVQDHLRCGGTERQSVSLANAFARAGHSCGLVTFRPGGVLAATVAPGVAHRALQPFDTRLDWFAPGLASHCARFQPDIILCMGRTANCRAGGLQRRLEATAVVATMRTGRPLPFRYRASLWRARAIVANSDDAARKLEAAYALPSTKIAVIRNSLVFPAIEDTKPHLALRQLHGAGPATVVLLCVAMFRPGKNQATLLQIVSRLPRELDWQLWLAGEGTTLPAAKTLATQLGLSDRVKFLGYQADPTPLYAAADVALLASTAESLSNFLIEAQAHGLPAVAFDVGGVRECFIPERTGWAVPPGDADAFLARLQSLLAPGGWSVEAAAMARAFARDGFAPERQSRAYLELFVRLGSVT